MMSCRRGQLCSLLIAILFILCFRRVLSDECDANGETSKRIVAIEPNADITIAALLDVHEIGVKGLLDCGNVSREGIAAFEALEWIIGLLNQENGVINGNSIKSSFIPGIKLGVKAFDACHHQDVAVRQLTELYPVLETGTDVCRADNYSQIETIGVLDMTGISLNPSLSEHSRRNYIPLVSLSHKSAIPPDTIGKILAQIIHDLEWTQIAVVHENDEHSVHIVKLLGQVAMTSRICLSSVESLPNLEQSSNEDNSRGVAVAYNAVVSHAADNSPIIVIGSGISVKKFVDVILENLETSSKFRWLFSSLPDPEIIRPLAKRFSNKVFALSAYPGSISLFEDFWQQLQKPNTNGVTRTWFDEFVELSKKCERGNCYNKQLPEGSIDILWRTHYTLPVIHSVFTFAHALRNAWTNACKGAVGLCDDMKRISRKEFVTEYLEPFQFEHNTSLRSPPEVSGRKSEQSRAGEIEGLQLALTKFDYRNSGNVGYSSVIVYDTASDSSKITDENFILKPSPCPPGGCRKCVKVRQSRIEVNNKLDPLMNSENEAIESYQIAGRPTDITIPLIIPIHRSGKSPLECSDEINSAAIYDLEGALWMIDQIHGDHEFAPGINFGVTVIDSCSSSLKAVEKVSKFLSEKMDPVLGTVSLENALSVITSSPSSESKSVVHLLSSLNVTVISAQDLTPTGLTLGSDHNILQTTVPYRQYIRATVEQLKYFGWTYVSIVMTKTNEESEAMTSYFKELAVENGICVSTVAILDESDLLGSSQNALMNLKQAKDSGSKAVVVLAGFDSTRALITTFMKFITTETLHRNEFSWILVAESNLNIVNGLELELMGSIALREGQGSVKTFIEYFSHLKPETNHRNPWFKDFWLQTTSCKLDDCLIRQMNPITTINTMQSVLALISGFARLRNELCGNESGICRRMQSKSDIRNRISHFIQYTAAVFTTPVSKDIGDMFSFTLEGFGAKAIDILNFKKDSTRSDGLFRFDQVAVYDNAFKKLPSRVYISYDEIGNDMPTEKLKSECVFVETCVEKCQKNADLLFLESNDNLYISAAISVHEESTVNPLQCGQLSVPNGIQNLEAFMWAMDTVNGHTSILPGVRLGSLVLDTCTSHQKTARDVSNFLSGTSLNLDKKFRLPVSKNVMGFIVDSDNVKIVDAVVDVTQPLQISTVAAHVRNSKYDDLNTFPKLLRTTQSNQVYADSIISVLLHFGWSFVSVLYEDDKGSLIDTYNQFKAKSEVLGIELAIEEKVLPQNNPNLMVSIIHRLQKKTKLGSRVVVLLLSDVQITYLLDALKKLNLEKQVNSNDFIWVAIDGRDAFHGFPRESLGAISIMPSLSPVTSFKNYFTSLDLRNNTRNPWFREYWERINNCRGMACYGIESAKQVINERQTLATINSVFAISHGLEMVRRLMCPGMMRGICPEMRDHPKISEMVYEFIRKTTFVGADGKKVHFSDNTNYAFGNLNIYNLRYISSKAAAFINVGRFNEKDGLFINVSKAFAYNENGVEISFRDIVSRCLEPQKCQSVMGHQSRSATPSALQVLPSHSFTVGALLPLHQPGNSFFTCGEIDTKKMFQNLIAFNFAIDKINANKSLLSDTKMGAIVIDYCGRKERAEEKLFTYFAETNYEMFKIPPKTLIALITFSDEVGNEIEPILNAHKIPHLTVPAANSAIDQTKSTSLALRTVPRKSVQVDAIVDILLEFQWKYINLIFDNENLYKSFKHKAVLSKVCVNSEIDLSEQEYNATYVGDLFDKRLSLKSEAKIIVTLLDSKRNKLLLSSLNKQNLENFVFIGNEDLIEAVNEINVAAKVIAIKVESYSNEEFKKYYSSLSFGNYGSIPMSWFEEFWQIHFQCQLPNSIVIQSQFSNICSGQERIDPSTLIEDDYVQHTIVSVLGIAKGLENYLKKHCVPGSLLTSIDDCSDTARESLNEQIRQALTDNEEVNVNYPRNMVTPYGFLVLSRLSGKEFSNAGIWKNGILKLLFKSSLQNEIGSNFKSSCTTKCAKCFEQFKSEQLTAKPQMTANFRRTWGMITSSLSGVGVIAVILCGLYFLMVFPVNVGTTVLGYFILLGLFTLFSVNFLFLIPVDFPVCWMRRFGMSIAYSIILSGMLVKVMNTWRLMAYRNARAEELKLTTACGLLFVAGGLVVLQIVVTVVWLFIYPPKPGFHDGFWSCSQNNSNFIIETESIVSLLYILLLLVITIFFSALTWKCYDSNYEPRYIMLCCVGIAITWITWTTFTSTLFNSRVSREVTIISVNLTNATLIMVTLFLRKLYIYRKLSKKVRSDRECKARLHPSSFPASLYGTVHKTNPIVWEKKPSMYGKRNATRPPFETDQIDDGASSCGSTTGSVQVQAQDLYPMEVYDGGSQFQAMSSLFNANSNRSLYLMDDSTYIR